MANKTYLDYVQTILSVKTKGKDVSATYNKIMQLETQTIS